MGCTYSDDQWQNAMERAEDRLIELSECDVKATYVTIEVDDKPFKIRKYEIGAEDEGKKTLVMVHGYAVSGPYYSHLWKSLSKNYRIVSFDNLGWGLNTRLQECKGSGSPEQAEQWVLDWTLKAFDALELPEKFLLMGHSYGGYMVALYAAHRPERVE